IRDLFTIGRNAYPAFSTTDDLLRNPAKNRYSKNVNRRGSLTRFFPTDKVNSTAIRRNCESVIKKLGRRHYLNIIGGVELSYPQTLISTISPGINNRFTVR